MSSIKSASVAALTIRLGVCSPLTARTLSVVVTMTVPWDVAKNASNPNKTLFDRP